MFISEPQKDINSTMTSAFKCPSDFSGGLYFLDGKRTTVESEKTFPVMEPRIGRKNEIIYFFLFFSEISFLQVTVEMANVP